MEHSKKEIVNQTIEFIRNRFKHDGSGHDWWHIFRVWQMAETIAATEGGDLFLIGMASLLHDLDDWKISGSDNLTETSKWLINCRLNNDEIERISGIINQISFKGAEVDTIATTTEAKVVQDADRLDAIGAIGVARAFAYGGSKGRMIYDPESQPVMHLSFIEYKGSKTATINHFYEKLLLLKDRMQTKTGRAIAEKRHLFLEQFLDQFFKEWNGKL